MRIATGNPPIFPVRRSTSLPGVSYTSSAIQPGSPLSVKTKVFARSSERK